ncbi:hypothetical protein M432DRAFT_107812 [Thermoascus aurantiacus ATCC 26904]
MIQDTEPQLSQTSLAPPAEISVPSTPVRRTTFSASPDLRSMAGNPVEQSDSASFFSPPPVSSSDMTPPPSSQIHGAPVRPPRSSSNMLPASPPDAIDRTLCAAYGASENLPSAEDIETANESQLRKMARDLLSVAQESRMSALHFKLQNSLLSFASNEAVKRAEVEHQLARREVEILQSSEYRNRQCATGPKIPQPSPNPQLEAALRRNHELERINATLERRLRRAKKLIEEEKDKFELLVEENNLLKKRIRDNREHFSRMFDQGSLSCSPRTEFQTPQRKPATRYPDSARSHMSRGGSHDPFAALLAADQVLSGEPASVTSTPARNRVQKQQHVRGTHSLSSLPVTPSYSRQTPNETQYITPGSRQNDEGHLGFSESISQEQHVEQGRHDRDSTISASDADEAVTDEDIPASQASSLATNMLRRSPGTSQDEVSLPGSIGKSSTLLQSKLFGQIKKPGVERPSSYLKRKASFEDHAIAMKKSKGPDNIGLGIESWNAPNA